MMITRVSLAQIRVTIPEWVAVFIPVILIIRSLPNHYPINIQQIPCIQVNRRVTPY